MSTFAKSSFAALLCLLPCVAACDAGGSFPLELEVKDGAGTPGKKPDEIELVVKTIPDTELKFEGQTVNTGDKPTASFTIPKSQLRLGKNTFAVEATTGVLFSKKSAKASTTWDAPMKTFVRFYPVATQGEASLTCGGVMCGATTFKIPKADAAGTLALEGESSLPGVLRVGGQQRDVGPGKRGAFTVDLARTLAGLPLAQRDTLSLPVELEVRGDKASDSLVLQGSLDSVLARELARVEHGPVAFPGDTPAPSDPRGIAVVLTSPQGASKLLLAGKASNVDEIDLVTVAKPAERFFACGGAATSASGILYMDLELKTYERRTGKVVGTRKLMADRVPCPPTPTAGQVKAEVREADVSRAAAEQLKKT